MSPQAVRWRSRRIAHTAQPQIAARHRRSRRPGVRADEDREAIGRADVQRQRYSLHRQDDVPHRCDAHRHADARGDAHDLLGDARGQLRGLGLDLAQDEAANEELLRLRALYEPYALSLAGFLRLELPPWIKRDAVKDNWQTTAWQARPHHHLGRHATAPDEHA